MVARDSDNELGLDEIGIKAAALNHMRRLSFIVPEYSILTSEFFENYAKSADFYGKGKFILEEYKSAEEASRHLQRIINETKMPSELIDKIAQTIASLKSTPLTNMEDNSRFVVRGSKPYISSINSPVFLNLKGPEDIERSIRNLYADHFSLDALRERQTKGMPLLESPLPVVLQVFANPEVTGIIMPYKENPDNFYLVAWRGFGYEMDFSKADHYIVNHRDLMIERFLNNASGEVIFFDEGEDSITRTQILHEEAEKPFLNHNQIIELCEIYKKNSENLGNLALEFKIRGSHLSFISMKDSKIMLKAQSALEELRRQGEASSNANVSMSGSQPMHKGEQVMDNEEQGNQVPGQAMPHESGQEYSQRPEGQTESPGYSEGREEEFEAGDEEDEDDEVLIATSEVLELHSEIIEKYIAINPDLARVLKMVKDDFEKEISAIEEAALSEEDEDSEDEEFEEYEE